MLQFLQSMFPDHELESLQRVLDSNDNNIDECIKALLVDDALEVDADLQHLTTMFPQEELEYLYKTYMDKDGKLEATIDQILSQRSLADSKNKIILPRSIAKSKNSSFKWTIEMLHYAKELCSAFPQFEEESINDVLEASDGKIELAAKELADIVSRNDNIKQRQDEELSTLATMFPDIPVSHLMHIIQKGKSLQENVEMLLKREGSDSSVNAWSQPISTKFKKKEKSEPSIQFHYDESGDKERGLKVGTRTPHLDPQALRNKAQELIYQRNCLFEKAASAYKKGQLTGLSSASFYAQQARDLDLKVKLANQAACKTQLEFNHKIHNYNEAILDLHGLTVLESLEVLKVKTNSWKLKNPLRIITGAGNHSMGKGKLFDSSINYITCIGWKIEKDQMGNGWFDARPNPK
jgi:hypothetical protein